jgi:hypothetical protein
MVNVVKMQRKMTIVKGAGTSGDVIELGRQ